MSKSGSFFLLVRIQKQSGNKKDRQRLKLKRNRRRIRAIFIGQMSLLVPNARDRVDTHGDLDQDEVYYEKIAKLQHELPWEFTLVSGFFKQSDAMTDDMTFNYVEEDFGCQADWATLLARLRELNDNSPENECYKLLFLARHGQGFHNIASAKYLKQAWTEKWRFLGGDGEIVWGPDDEYNCSK